MTVPPVPDQPLLIVLHADDEPMIRSWVKRML